MCHLSTVLSTIRSKTWEHYHLCKLSQDRGLSQTPMLWGQGSIIDPYTRHTVSQHKTSTITMRHSVVVGNKGTKILSPYLSGAPGPICMLLCKVPIWATRVSWPSQASRPLSPREHILMFASMCMFNRTCSIASLMTMLLTYVYISSKFRNITFILLKISNLFFWPLAPLHNTYVICAFFFSEIVLNMTF